MNVSSYLRNIIISMALFSMGGCGTTIPPEKYGEYAFILSGVPDSTYGCAPGSMIDCVFIGYIDGKVQLPASPKFVLTPGMHTIGLGNSHFGYTFDAKAGYRYVIYRSQILVSLRSEPVEHTIDKLVLVDGKFIPSAEANYIITSRQKASDDAFKEKQLADMPFIRKIGAEVCQRTSNGSYTHGYVEAVTDNKIKINIDSGIDKGRIIYDFPTLWILCGHN